MAVYNQTDSDQETLMDQTGIETTLNITEAVSEALQTPICELPPLSESIDPGALETLVSNNPKEEVTISFSYAGLHVVVRSGAIVSVYPIDRPRELE